MLLNRVFFLFLLSWLISCNPKLSDKDRMLGLFPDKASIEYNKGIALMFVNKGNCISCYSVVNNTLEHLYNDNNIPASNILVVVPGLREIERESFGKELLQLDPRFKNSPLINDSNDKVKDLIRFYKIDTEHFSLLILNNGNQKAEYKILK